MGISDSIQTIAQIIDLAGIGVIVFGSVWATAKLVSNLYNKSINHYKMYRQDLGRFILLGLEFLIASDIIRSVGWKPDLQNVVILAILVVIRSFLSFTFGLEIEGRSPWQVSKREMA